MDSDWYRPLGVRYLKLYFTLVFTEDTMLPVNKVSALRGGMGEMLLRMNCVRDRNCENCDFESECIVRRMMYSQYEIKPDFVTTGESVGYVLECEDNRELFFAGDELVFRLLLFGKTIVYFNQFLQAFSMLGACGLGKNESRFRIAFVRNTTKEVLFDGEQIYMERYRIHLLSDYVTYRLARHTGEWNGELVFHTPLTLKYHGEFLQEFQIEPIIQAVRRRVYMLNCFEGQTDGWMEQLAEYPQIVAQQHGFVKVDRYSSRQGCAMTLKGIKGRAKLDQVNEELLAMLLVGELIHIGKNTSFGFGRYEVR